MIGSPRRLWTSGRVEVPRCRAAAALEPVHGGHVEEVVFAADWWGRGVIVGSTRVVVEGTLLL